MCVCVCVGIAWDSTIIIINFFIIIFLKGFYTAHFAVWSVIKSNFGVLCLCFYFALIPNPKRAHDQGECVADRESYPETATARKRELSS